MPGRVLFWVIAAFFLSLVLTRLAIPLARKWRILDYPDERKIHAQAVPRGGGIAFVVTWLAAAYSAIFMTGLAREALVPALAIAFGASLILLIGLWDDLKGMPPLTKLLLQLPSAALLTFAVSHPPYLPGSLAFILIFLWIVLLSNAFNLIDGLDGLAAGLALIASFFFVLLGLTQKQPLVVAFSALIGASCLGFLPFNWYPARIFMGDTGSLFLGYILGAIAILSAEKIERPVEIFVPVLFLAVPIFDTLLSVIRRLVHRRRLFRPDKAHFYNLLMNRGFSHKGSVIFSYCLGMLLGGFGILLKYAGGNLFGWLIAVLGVFLLALLVWRFRLWAER